jgi:hypothetical protein
MGVRTADLDWSGKRVRIWSVYAAVLGFGVDPGVAGEMVVAGGRRWSGFGW